MNQIARADHKYNAHVSAAVHLTYIACDGIAKEVFKQAQKKKVVTLKEDEEDTTRELMVEKIIDIVWKESPTYMVRAEV